MLKKKTNDVQSVSSCIKNCRYLLGEFALKDCATHHTRLYDGLSKIRRKESNFFVKKRKKVKFNETVKYKAFSLAQSRIIKNKYVLLYLLSIDKQLTPHYDRPSKNTRYETFGFKIARNFDE